MNMIADIDFKFIPCVNCSKKASWSYMPGYENFCDKCVPRGCSCNTNETGEQELDKDGQPWPCCEYSQIKEEEHSDKDSLKYGKEAYYKFNNL